MNRATKQLVAALAVLVPLAFFFGAMNGEPKAGGGPFGQSAAAWAQAIGSVAAVFAAVHAANLPIQAELARKAKEKREFLAVLQEVVGSIFSSTQGFREALASRDVKEIWSEVSGLEDMHLIPLSKLLDLPITIWPSPAIYGRASSFLGISKAFYANAATRFRHYPQELNSGDYIKLHNFGDYVQSHNDGLTFTLEFTMLIDLIKQHD